REVFPALGIRFGDIIHLGAVSLHDPYVHFRGARIDDAYELQSEPSAYRRHADRHIAGAGLDDDRTRTDHSIPQGILQHSQSRPILGAAGGVHQLQLGVDLNAPALREQCGQADKRGFADPAQPTIPHISHLSFLKMLNIWLPAVSGIFFWISRSLPAADA